MSKRERSSRFEPLGEAAEDLLNLRFGDKIAEYEAVKIWPEAVGEKIASRCIAIGIKSGILWVVVPNHVWLTEMKALKKKLIERVAERLGRKVVKDIKFKVGAVKRQK
ncbi:DUF721 domain-containing protein [candidate division WOR-3 bacterium]|nr:DUF721 domain-containing protein [candidate division WOR-3 bacterium]